MIWIAIVVAAIVSICSIAGCVSDIIAIKRAARERDERDRAEFRRAARIIAEGSAKYGITSEENHERH